MVRTDILSNSLFDEFKPPFEASEFQEEIIIPNFKEPSMSHIKKHTMMRANTKTGVHQSQLPG